MNPFAFELISKYEVSDPNNPPLTAYWDALGRVWTIGYGSTGPDITEGTTWSLQQAKDRLGQDILRFEKIVRSYVEVALSDQSLGSLISLEYNAGPSRTSTIYQLINNKQFILAASEFPKWDHCRNKEVLGLKIRRFDEGLTFLRGLVK